MATVKWMCSKLSTELRAQPDMPTKSMAKMLMENYGIGVANRTMYKARNMANEQLHGKQEESYNMLAAYVEMIKKTNPGSWALIIWHEPHGDQKKYFKAMFISFKPWIMGFLRGCRPIIGVDGCHLKGRYNGMLLSAMTLDANNNLYCIGYAIVGKETTESWQYFFRNLKLAFQQVGCVKWDWTFISDKMKGVDKALEKEFPLSTRRICAQHLYRNFKVKNSGPVYHELFWKAANVTSLYVFNKAMAKIERLSSEDAKYLMDTEQQWSIHQFDPNVVCPHNTSNFVESFNALINKLREMPVLSMMEGIRTYYMEKFAKRMDKAAGMQYYEPTPYAKEILEKNCSASRMCYVIRAGGGEYEVHEGSTAYTLNLNESKCLCGSWQATGIPCRHACRAIYHNRQEPVDYIHVFYTSHCYKLTYSEHMHPMPAMNRWDKFYFPHVLPPIQERMAGRLARKRKRSADQIQKKKGQRSTTITCSICKTLGHNARSCHGGPTAKEKKVAAARKKKKKVDGASSSKK
ncbi:hypothetical protein vseg_007315 [Gypsophila vaccaria]